MCHFERNAVESRNLESSKISPKVEMTGRNFKKGQSFDCPFFIMIAR